MPASIPDKLSGQPSQMNRLAESYTQQPSAYQPTSMLDLGPSNTLAILLPSMCIDLLAILRHKSLRITRDCDDHVFGQHNVVLIIAALESADYLVN